MLRALLVSAAVIALPAAAAPALAAQEGAHAAHGHHMAPRPGRITLSATGEVRAEPDMAVLSGGVTTRADTAADAMTANSRAMNQVFQALRRAGIAEADLQTARLQVSPVYDYSQNREARIVGYQATNTVSARVRDLDNLGRTIDAMIAAGVNEFQGVNFMLENQDAALRQARLNAVAELRAVSALYAEALGVRLGRIAEFSEQAGQAQPFPVARMMAMEAADSATPVAAGRVTVSVTVTASYEIDQ